MFIIDCPYCGKRDQAEFSYGGEAHVSRPEDPASLDEGQWADFVFFRTNTKGLFAERWNHAAGCRKWFNALRDTSSDRFYATYCIGSPRPEVEVPTLMTPSGEPDIGSGNDVTKVLRENSPEPGDR